MSSSLGAFLCPPGYAGPSGLGAMARESGAVVDVVRQAGRAASSVVHREGRVYTVAKRRRSADPVVLVPGFMAGDTSLLLMSRFLRDAGYRTYRSAIHANIGCTQRASSDLERRIEAIASRRDRKVHIVGHSLGGLLARTLASRRPDLVDSIITLGSPLLAPGAVHPVLAFDVSVLVALRRLGLGRFMGADCTSGDCARVTWEESRGPLDDAIRFTSIFSRRDGVVDWRGCLDPAADAVEVTTSHVGMALDREVFDVVALTLAQTVGATVEASVTAQEVSLSATPAGVPA